MCVYVYMCVCVCVDTHILLTSIFFDIFFYFQSFFCALKKKFNSFILLYIVLTSIMPNKQDFSNFHFYHLCW